MPQGAAGAGLWPPDAHGARTLQEKPTPVYNERKTMTDREGHDDKDFTILEPHSAPEGHSTAENVKDDAENVGEAAGSFLGGVSGMAFGIAGRPVGLVIGAIAGALGGW